MLLLASRQTEETIKIPEKLLYCENENSYMRIKAGLL